MNKRKWVWINKNNKRKLFSALQREVPHLSDKEVDDEIISLALRVANWVRCPSWSLIMTIKTDHQLYLHI